MIKNNLIKTGSLTIVAMCLTVSNSIYANAEDNINVDQMKSEIVKAFNSNLNDFAITADDLKFQAETTVSKEFNYQDTTINLTDEKLYCFSYSKYAHVTFYYGLTSKYVYVKFQGTGAGDLTVIKDGTLYAYFEFNTARYRDNTTYGWIGTNGWSKQSSNDWYYFKNGIVQTGWIYDNGNWYYCYSSGKMAQNITIDGYKLGSNGAWIE